MTENNRTEFDKESFPKMMTIREVAETGILKEHSLRLMAKAGQLPCFTVGETKKVLVNFDALVRKLQSLGDGADNE